LFYDPGRVDHLLQVREAGGLLALGPPNVFYLTGLGRSGGTGAVVLGAEPSHPHQVL
jgi:hypothetical protein